MNRTYLHQLLPDLQVDQFEDANIRVGTDADYDQATILNVVLNTLKLAIRLGVEPPTQAVTDSLPYETGHDSLVFKAPLITATVNKRILFLRGWKNFDGCVKGFNALGLMANHVLREHQRLTKMPSDALRAVKREYLASRKSGWSDALIFTAMDLDQLDADAWKNLSTYDLAIWSCFARRTIFCSTSSNMGISIHQALRMMQGLKLTCGQKELTLLNHDEGSLVIWAPDERADFMSPEKTQILRALEAEKPTLTRLQTYVNRQQRDPGALKDALIAGGYFFPTNPQSAAEMQNLLFVALKDLEQERGVGLAELLADANIARALDSIDAWVNQDHIIVERGIESGIYGLMVPYFILLEELFKEESRIALSTWNQASIGAALAAAVLADEILRQWSELPLEIRQEFATLFPSTGKFLESGQWGQDCPTRIHGVFDVANLQSLAQLLGVVVDHHQSGRGTAYVGLGSSSYSNGNRCFEILKESMNRDGVFKGNCAFHPATHTVNPFAQALIYGEDLYRYLSRCDDQAKLNDSVFQSIPTFVKKPEPAGAAALAGYLLTRLDQGTWSMMELAYGLRLMGFDSRTFLDFVGYNTDSKSRRSFLQHATEEGSTMGYFAQNMLVLLDWDESELRMRLNTEKEFSILKNAQCPLDDPDFDQQNGFTAIYLTGDNTQQPAAELVVQLASRCWKNRTLIQEYLSAYSKFSSIRRVVYNVLPLVSKS